MKVAVLAITKNGVSIGSRLAGEFPDMEVYAPKKLLSEAPGIRWYEEPTPTKIADLFGSYEGLICLFSLGAVVRLIAPHIRDKKTDPAVLVIDDKLNYVISVLSGHIGGANQLAREIAERMGSTPVITTAADVNRTIAVDLVGRDLGWVVDDDSTVTAVSAHMVNGERIGVYQDAGDRNWWAGRLPDNVTLYRDMRTMEGSGCRAFLIITDGPVPEGIRANSVVYRPPSLVAGVGLHQDTTTETIKSGLSACLDRHGLSIKSVAKLASLKKPRDVQGLIEAGRDLGVPIQYVDRTELARVEAPNPSDVVKKFEGTPSVSEAAAMLVSGGALAVEKQKFPPDLTVAVARIK